MHLTNKGKAYLRAERRDKRALAAALMKGEREIIDFVERGICYDVVAFVWFLLGRVSANRLTATTGNEWMRVFAFGGAKEWDGSSTIGKGTAVGFRRVGEADVFHAAVAVGGTRIRGVNQFVLSPAWRIPVGLKKALGSPSNDGTFLFDRANTRVYLRSTRP
jgi:hypothetical protein